jgi:hypothetical protein
MIWWICRPLAVATSLAVLDTLARVAATAFWACVTDNNQVPGRDILTISGSARPRYVPWLWYQDAVPKLPSSPPTSQPILRPGWPEYLYHIPIDFEIPVTIPFMRSETSTSQHVYSLQI